MYDIYFLFALHCTLSRFLALTWTSFTYDHLWIWKWLYLPPILEENFYFYLVFLCFIEMRNERQKSQAVPKSVFIAPSNSCSLFCLTMLFMVIKIPLSNQFHFFFIEKAPHSYYGCTKVAGTYFPLNDAFTVLTQNFHSVQCCILWLLFISYLKVIALKQQQN